MKDAIDMCAAAYMLRILTTSSVMTIRIGILPMPTRHGFGVADGCANNSRPGSALTQQNPLPRPGRLVMVAPFIPQHAVPLAPLPLGRAVVVSLVARNNSHAMIADTAMAEITTDRRHHAAVPEFDSVIEEVERWREGGLGACLPHLKVDAEVIRDFADSLRR